MSSHREHWIFNFTSQKYSKLKNIDFGIKIHLVCLLLLFSKMNNVFCNVIVQALDKENQENEVMINLKNLQFCFSF